jgi:ketosteroid isomerase-like protein
MQHERWALTGLGSEADTMGNSDAAAHAAHDAYVNAINSNDVGALLATMTDDIVYLPPNSPAIVGTQDVGPWLADYFGAFESKWVKTSVEFVVHEDLAYEWYTYQSTDTPRDGTGETVTDKGNGINIYRRGEDGTWRVWRDMWTTEAAAG